MDVKNFIDPTAIVPDSTRQACWHFCRILADVELGEDCSVGSGAEIGKGSSIGARTRISAGVFLPNCSVVGEAVFIGPNVTFTDDMYPKTLGPGETYDPQPPVVEDHASIGAGSVVLPGVKIGRYALVGAGSVVTHDVAPHSKVYGNPARAQGDSDISPLSAAALHG